MADAMSDMLTDAARTGAGRDPVIPAERHLP